MKMFSCAACDQQILDRYFSKVLDRNWHINCIQCSDCSIKLIEKCYSRDGRIFCKDDFRKRFGKKCKSCGIILNPQDLVMKMKEQVYHPECLKCDSCNKPLTRGDLCSVRNGLVYCHSHLDNNNDITNSPIDTATSPNISPSRHFDEREYYNSETAIHPCVSGPEGLTSFSYGSPGMIPGASLPGGSIGPGVRKGRPRKRKVHSDPKNCSILENGCNESIHPSQLSGLTCPVENLSDHGIGNSLQPGTKAKRMRTSFKHAQLKAMKEHFDTNQNPDSKDLKNLAQKTGLTKRVLQVWFQNARAKWRKSHSKSQTDGQMQSNSNHKPSSPSTGIASPGSSTRPFSTPSPSSVIIQETSLLANNSISNGSSLDQFSPVNSLSMKQSPPSPSHLHSIYSGLHPLHHHLKHNSLYGPHDKIIPQMASLQFYS